MLYRKNNIGVKERATLEAASITAKEALRVANKTLEFLVNCIKDWSKDTEYTVGNLCKHDNHIYKCCKDHISGNEFDADAWTNVMDIYEGYGNAGRTSGIG